MSLFSLELLTHGMINIGFLSLSVIFRISFSQTRYFIQNRLPEETTEIDGPDFQEDDDVDKIVVDLYYLSFVKYLTFDGHAGSSVRKVYTVYIGDTKRHERECPRDAANDVQFNCNHFARVVVIEGENIKGRQRVVADDTGLYKYVGCFETSSLKQLDPLEKSLTTDSECSDGCPYSTFHALTMDKKCYCLEDALGLIQVKMQLCDKKFEDKPYLFWGGNGYVSVYVRHYDDINQEIETPFECFFYNKNCPECPASRKGFGCEHIVCKENRGNCRPMACDSVVIDKHVTYGRCICKTGFDEDYICHDKDEGVNETKDDEVELKPTEIPLAAYGFIVFAILCSLLAMLFLSKINADTSTTTSSSSS